jgi:hypothetical protein
MPVLTDFEPSSHLQSVIGEQYAKEHRIIAVEIGTKIIKLVLAEPSLLLMEELQRAVPFGKEIEFYLASHSMVDECFLKMADSFSFD